MVGNTNADWYISNELCGEHSMMVEELRHSRGVDFTHMTAWLLGYSKFTSWCWSSVTWLVRHCIAMRKENCFRNDAPLEISEASVVESSDSSRHGRTLVSLRWENKENMTKIRRSS